MQFAIAISRGSNDGLALIAAGGHIVPGTNSWFPSNFMLHFIFGEILFMNKKLVLLVTLAVFLTPAFSFAETDFDAPGASEEVLKPAKDKMEHDADTEDLKKELMSDDDMGHGKQMDDMGDKADDLYGDDSAGGDEADYEGDEGLTIE